MNVLALDLATKTGWALGAERMTESGVQVFDVKRGESPGMRYVRFRRWLDEIATAADLIVYEQTVSSPGRIAVEIADGLATRVQEYCALQKLSGRSVEHQPVYPATIKKFVTGKGNAKKPAVIEAVIRRGWFPAGRDADDNEIDAIALFHYALAEIVPQSIPAGRR